MRIKALSEDFSDTADCLDDVLARLERGDADVALPALAESGSGGRYDISFVEELVEEVPAVAL